MSVTVIERFEIHRAADDDPRGHLCEPRIARRSDGTIALTFRTGTTRGSADGSPRLLLSDEGSGRKWRDAGLPYLGRPEAAGGDLRGSAPAFTRDGSLLTVTIWLDRLDPSRPIYHPATEGLTDVRNLLARSHDDGTTWSFLGDLGIDIPQAASQTLLALPDGEVLCTFETFKRYDEPGRWVYRGGITRSPDGGSTWGETVISAVMSDAGTMWWDPRIARLSDGTLIQFYYAYEHDRGGESPVHAGWSRDGGRTWTEPSPTPLVGQATFPVVLASGVLLAFSQRRDASQCMVVRASDDGGRTWRDGETVVYRHEEESAPAAAPGIRPIDYLASMDRFTFGHPCGVPLTNDHALLVWYAGGETRTAIHGAIVTTS